MCHFAGELMFLNMAYEVFAYCTSIIAQTPYGLCHKGIMQRLNYGSDAVNACSCNKLCYVILYCSADFMDFRPDSLSLSCSSVSVWIFVNYFS